MAEYFGNLVLLFIVLCLSLFVYFLPAVIGFSKKRPAKWGIFWLNVFLGWTFVGWVAAFVWAVVKPREVTTS